MDAVTLLSLTAIAVTWVVALRLGYRLSRSCGVSERASACALALVPPTAGLVCAVHVVMTVSLAADAAIVTPAPIAVAFALLTCLGARLARTLGDDKLRSVDRPDARDREPLGWVVWPTALVAAMYAVFLVDAVTRYPTGYDGLHYHLPVAVGWMRTGRMDLTPGLLHQSFPENGMIVPFLLAFLGGERLLTIIHLPKALWVGLSVFGLSRVIGIKPRAALVGALIALSVPMVVFQSFSSYIDLYAAAAWLAALLALAWVARTPDGRRRKALIIIAGLSAGVALGSKTTFLLLVPLLGLVAMIAERMSSGGTVSTPSKPLRAAVLFGIASLACSFGWFARGAVQAGNPVYPLALEVGGQKVLPGITAKEHFPTRTMGRKLARWWSYPWRETKHSGTGYPYSVNNALGAAYTTFVPIGFAAVLWAVWRRRGRSVERSWLLVCAALVGVGVVLLLTLFCEMLRFVLPLVVLGSVFGAWIVGRLIQQHPRLTPVLAGAAFAVTALLAGSRPAHALAGRIRDGVWQRSEFYGLPRVVDELAPGAKILNLGSLPATYPLLGENLDHEVITALQWNVMLDGRAMSAAVLREHGIDHVYLDASTPDDWASDLALTPLGGDASRDARVAGRLYAVTPQEPRIAGRSQR